jgi:hypothetical protein
LKNRKEKKTFSTVSFLMTALTFWANKQLILLIISNLSDTVTISRFGFRSFPRNEQGKHSRIELSIDLYWILWGSVLWKKRVFFDKKIFQIKYHLIFDNIIFFWNCFLQLFSNN